MEVAAQAIIFGDELTKHLDENLGLLRSVGFKALEVGPLFLEFGSVEQLADLLHKHGLYLCGFHTGTRSIVNQEEFNKLCDTLNKLRCKNFICSGILAGGSTREYYERTGSLLRERTVDAALKGIKLHYHNHDWELSRTFGTQSGLQVIFDNAHEDTGFVLDTYWAKAGMADPFHLWSRFQPKIKMIHLKDGIPRDIVFSPLGKGECKVDAYFDLFSKKELDFIVWEQDLTHDRTIRDCVETSARWLKERLKNAFKQ